MKRPAEDSCLSDQTKKIKFLNEQQIKTAPGVISMLKQGRSDLAKTILELSFSNSKAIESLLSCTKYESFKWAITNKNFELTKYFIEHNTDHGKFLALCYNNYENIYNFLNIYFGIKEINPIENNSFIDILKLFITVKPVQTIPLLQEIINKKDESDIKVVEIKKILDLASTTLNAEDFLFDYVEPLGSTNKVTFDEE
ncbi:MAG TPA: hypothetical protein LFW21_02990 [Rickettsia endosymbiont of Pyrocoelia pectoralis]|nr:hypothetical protein [Rickettsia endosymbiont of Pyrocoelia pectoralis]